MQLIDTHCHLDVTEFDADRELVLTAARAVGVIAQVIPGIAAAGWTHLLQLCTSHADLYPALGLHPLFLDQHDAARDLAALERQLADTTLTAVGEIGLDYAPAAADRAGQQLLFTRQLALAHAARLPVLLHVRRAHDDVLTILQRQPNHGGIVHAFNGSADQARRYLELGFKLGFGGMLTFTRSTRLRRLAQILPLSAIVLETDAPDLTVASHQYQRNSPAYLPEVLTALAELRQITPELAAAQTTQTAAEVLNLRLPT
ncbi:TatD family hydrolase [Rhodoferax sp. 4810]|uniref:TatD family hydrolase n=1 Tax=Thiospirillum jenense TaxID=1653858 RepID=A0A839HBX8_9GAMM|nr:TatD family hydrolase [Thiospirillum jenense]MBB1072988.1 TatD family hydrolase [Rhodoferax jenense]MBB1124936.1 TatD family hydrolase [Thiospirillum jenense]